MYYAQELGIISRLKSQDNASALRQACFKDCCKIPVYGNVRALNPPMQLPIGPETAALPPPSRSDSFCAAFLLQQLFYQQTVGLPHENSG
jgi:hypothetical protein